MKFLLLMLIALPLSGFVFSQRAIAGDICGNMTLEQCKQAAREAIELRERSSGKNVNAEQFQRIYTDPYNKLSWSKALSGLYSNGCLDDNGFFQQKKNCGVEKVTDGSRQVKVEESNAAKACKSIGARLPTKAEFESLINNFDHSQESYGPRLTDKGKAEMQAVFGDMNNSFWSSTLIPSPFDDDGILAYFFRVHGGFVDYEGYGIRATLYAVRCVVSR